MNTPPSDRVSLVGRFIIEAGGVRRTGLTATETARFLNENPDDSAVIYRIHRVTEDGRMELVGVPPRLFQAEDGLLFRRREADAARADFDALCGAALETPPPCRVRVQLMEDAGAPHAHVLAVIFPTPCMESVGHWLQHCRLRLGDDVEAGVAALQAYLTASPRIVKEQLLTEACS